MRVIKQKQELAAMRQAIKITVSGINKVAKRLEKFKFEYEIEAALFSEFKKRGATGHAFDPIIAAGANGCQLHYLANKSPIGKGPILLDVGAEVDHYAADITRTYPLGQFTKRQQAVFDRVEEVQKYALELLKPGVILKDYEKSVRDYMGEKLRELGLIKTIDEASVRKYFPSLTSHYLGLDVHDVGYYDRPLEPGMVLTVEPGIYIQKEGIGVRIEDDVLITDKGVEVLSRGLPTGLR
jgi:Xaa-Pro aminopeptidase